MCVCALTCTVCTTYLINPSTAEFTKMKEELPESLAKAATKNRGEKNGDKDTASGEGVKESGNGGEEEVKGNGKDEVGEKEGGDKVGEKEGGGGKLPEALSMPSDTTVQSAAASALAAAAVKAKVRVRCVRMCLYIMCVCVCTCVLSVMCDVVRGDCVRSLSLCMYSTLRWWRKGR